MIRGKAEPCGLLSLFPFCAPEEAVGFRAPGRFPVRRCRSGTGTGRAREEPEAAWNLPPPPSKSRLSHVKRKRLQLKTGPRCHTLRESPVTARAFVPVGDTSPAQTRCSGRTRHRDGRGAETAVTAIQRGASPGPLRPNPTRTLLKYLKWQFPQLLNEALSNTLNNWKNNKYVFMCLFLY